MCYFGVPIKGATYLLVDNKTVVDSSAFPYSRLHKLYQMLSYHRFREAIAAKL